MPCLRLGAYGQSRSSPFQKRPAGDFRRHAKASYVERSIRRRGQAEESDERILGSGDFVNAILKEAEEKARRQLKVRRTDKNLIKIIEEECKKGRASGNELRGGSRRRKVSTVRARIAKRGLEELGLSMAEIARHVGVTTASIAKAVARLEDG